MRPVSISLLLCLLSVSTLADVTSAGPGGFTLEHEVTIAAGRARVWQAAIDEVGLWWHDDHTISGNATRMRIDARPLGCFCEDLPGEDGIVHLMVTSVSSNVMLRMTGELGPLGLMGVNGNMTWEFFAAGDATRVKFSYAVGGYRQGGLDGVAVPVDYVIGEALALLKAHVEGSSADDVGSD